MKITGTAKSPFRELSKTFESEQDGDMGVVDVMRKIQKEIELHSAWEGRHVQNVAIDAMRKLRDGIGVEKFDLLYKKVRKEDLLTQEEKEDVAHRAFPLRKVEK